MTFIDWLHTKILKNKLALALVIAVCAVSGMWGTDYVYDGSWSPSTPTIESLNSGDTVNIKYNLSYSTGLTIPSGVTVTVENGFTLSISNADFTVNGTLINNGTTTSAKAFNIETTGSVTNNGTLTSGNASTNDGNFTNNGSYTASGGTYTNNGTIINSGTFTAENTLVNNGSFINSGTLNNKGGVLSNYSEITGTGSITCSDGVTDTGYIETTTITDTSGNTITTSSSDSTRTTASTFYWVGTTGYWNNANNWKTNADGTGSNGIPGIVEGDIAYIPGTKESVITIPSGFTANCASIYTNSGASSTYNVTININGTLTTKSIYTNTGSSSTGNTTINVNGKLTTNGSADTGGSGDGSGIFTNSSTSTTETSGSIGSTIINVNTKTTITNLYVDECSQNWNPNNSSGSTTINTASNVLFDITGRIEMGGRSNAKSSSTLNITGSGETACYVLDPSTNKNFTQTIDIASGATFTINHHYFGDAGDTNITNFTGSGTLKIPASGAYMNWGTTCGMSYADTLDILPSCDPSYYKVEFSGLSKFPTEKITIKLVLTNLSGGTELVTFPVKISNVSGTYTITDNSSYNSSYNSETSFSLTAQAIEADTSQSYEFSSSDATKFTLDIYTPDNARILATLSWESGKLAWTGAVSTVWSNTENWIGLSESTVAASLTSTTDLTISNSCTNFPKITSDDTNSYTLNSLTIAPNASMTISGGTLNATSITVAETGKRGTINQTGGTVNTSSITLNGSSVYNGTGGTVSFTATSSTLTNNVTDSASFGNINVPSGNTLTVNGNLIINGDTTDSTAVSEIAGTITGATNIKILANGKLKASEGANFSSIPIINNGKIYLYDTFTTFGALTNGTDAIVHVSQTNENLPSNWTDFGEGGIEVDSNVSTTISTGITSKSVKINSGADLKATADITAGTIDNEGTIEITSSKKITCSSSYSGSSDKLSITSGTFDYSGSATTIATLETTTAAIINGGDYGITVSSATYSSAPNITTGGIVSLPGGTIGALTVNSGKTTLTDDTNISSVSIGASGNLTGTSGKNISVGGNWSNGNTTSGLDGYTANSGTVIFTDSASISGSNTFYNLTCTSTGKTLTFKAGSKQTVSNQLTITGSKASPIILQSSSAGTTWKIEAAVSGTTTASVSGVKVQDSFSTNDSITATSSLSLGNNTNWKIPGTYKWTSAATSTAWTTASNWQILELDDTTYSTSKTYPQFAEDVVEIADKTCVPTLSAALTVGTLTIDSTGAIDLADKTITATSVENNGTVYIALNSSTPVTNSITTLTENGTVVYTGNTQSSGLPWGYTYKNIEFNGAASAIINSACTISGTTTINTTKLIKFTADSTYSGLITITSGGAISLKSASNMTIAAGASCSSLTLDGPATLNGSVTTSAKIGSYDYSQYYEDSVTLAADTTLEAKVSSSNYLGIKFDAGVSGPYDLTLKGSVIATGDTTHTFDLSDSTNTTYKTAKFNKGFSDNANITLKGNAEIYDSNTFNSLSVDNSKIAAATTVKFEGGETQKITSISAKGNSQTNTLTLDSTDSSTKWNAYFNGTTPTASDFSFVKISNSNSVDSDFSTTKYLNIQPDLEKITDINLSSPTTTGWFVYKYYWTGNSSTKWNDSGNWSYDESNTISAPVPDYENSISEIIFKKLSGKNDFDALATDSFATTPANNQIKLKSVSIEADNKVSLGDYVFTTTKASKVDGTLAISPSSAKAVISSGTGSVTVTWGDNSTVEYYGGTTVYAATDIAATNYHNLTVTGSNTILQLGAQSITVAGTLSNEGTISSLAEITVNGAMDNKSGASISASTVNISGDLKDEGSWSSAIKFNGKTAQIFTANAGTTYSTITNSNISADGLTTVNAIKAEELYNNQKLTLGSTLEVTSLTNAGTLVQGGKLTADAITNKGTITAGANELETKAFSVEAGYSNSVSVDGGTLTVSDTAAAQITIPNVTVSTSAALNGGTKGLKLTDAVYNSSDITTSGSVELCAGTIKDFTVSSGAATLAGDITAANITIENGSTLAVSSSNQVTVNKDWTNSNASGCFTPNLSTIIFDDSNQHTISGNQSFYNVELKNSTAINGSNSYNNFTAGTSASGLGGKTITLNADQTVNGTLTLNGTSTASKLSILDDGTNKGFRLSASPSEKGAYLLIGPTVQIKNTTDGTCDGIEGIYYTAENSVPSTGTAATNAEWAAVIKNGWRIKDLGELSYTWTGSTTDWATRSNWDIGIVPGITAAGQTKSTGAAVTIPAGKSAYPQLSGISYSAGSIAIESAASVTFTGSGNIAITEASGLSNSGTIIYQSDGRFVNASGSPINDSAKGKVEYAGTGTGTISDVDYYDLLISSGSWTGSSAKIINSNLSITGGAAIFNASVTAGSISVANAPSIQINAGLTCAGEISIPATVTSLTLGGTIDSGSNNQTYSIPVRLSADTILNAGTGTVELHDSISGADRKLTLNSSTDLENDITFDVSTVIFNKNVTSASGKTITVNGETQIADNVTLSSSSITFAGNVSGTTAAADFTLSAPVVLTNDISLTAQNVTFQNNISGSGKILSLFANAGFSGAAEITADIINHGTINVPSASNSSVAISFKGNYTANDTTGGASSGALAGTKTSDSNLSPDPYIDFYRNAEFGTLNVNGDTIRFAGSSDQSLNPNGQIFADLIFNNSSTTTASDSFTAANITIDNGSTLAVSSSNQVTVNKDWTNRNASDGFTPNLSTIIFDDSNQHTISGNQSFYNVELKNSTAINGSNSYNNFTTGTSASGLGGKTITFQAGETQTISGKFTASGTDENNLLTLKSSTDGTQWKISAYNHQIEFVKVSDSNNTTSSNYLFALSSIDSGNNTRWNFPGHSYTWKGSASGNKNDWNTAANWEENSIPGIGSIITIPAGKTDYPLLTADLNLNESYNSTNYSGTITVADGAEFDLADRSLITGTITSYGKVRLQGTETQTITAAMSNGTDSTVEYYGGSTTNLCWDGDSSASGNQYANLLISGAANSTDTTLISVASTLTINAATNLASPVQAVGLTTINTTGGVTLDNGANLFTGGVTLTNGGAVTLNAASSFDITTGAAASSLTVNSPVNLAGTVITSGNQTYNSTVTTNGDLTASTVNFNGNVTLNADTKVSAATIFNCTEVSGTGKNFTLDGAVTLSADLGITAAKTDFNSTLNGAKALTITGNAVFQAAVGETTQLSSISVSGTTEINTTNIKTSGNQTYADAVTIGAQNTTFSANSGSLVKFQSTLTGNAQSLTIATAGAEFDNLVSGFTTIEIDGTTTVNAASITTTAAQTYNGEVTVGTQNLIFASGADNLIWFKNKVTGSNNQLSISTADVQFDGDVSAFSTISVDGKTNINTASITAVTSQEYKKAVTLSHNSELSAPTVTFDSTVDGGNTLTVSGAAILKGLVGNTTQLSSITITGATDIQTSSIKTSGNQNYNDEVTLTAAAVSISSGTDKEITFAKNINGSSKTLTIVQGTAVLSDDVTVQPAVINNAAITTKNNVTFNAAYSGTSATFNAGTGNVIFNSNIDLSGTTFKAQSGTVTVSPATEPATLTGQANGSTAFNNFVITGSVTLGPSINYANFTAGTSASGLGGKTITFQAGATQTISGKFTASGTDENNLLTLKSSTDGTQWKINAGSQDSDGIKYVDIKDSNNISTNRLNAAYPSTDSGNNDRWNFTEKPYTWTGAGSDSNWFNKDNWDIKSIPGIGAVITIPVTTNNPVLEHDLLNDETEYASVGSSGTITVENSAIFDLSDRSLYASTITNSGRIRLAGTQTITAATKATTIENKDTSTVEYYGNCSTNQMSGNAGTSNYNKLEFTNGANGTITAAITVADTTLIANGASNELVLSGNNIFSGDVTFGDGTYDAGTITLNSIEDFTISADSKAASLTITAKNDTENKTVNIKGNLTTTTATTIDGNLTNSGTTILNYDVLLTGNFIDSGTWTSDSTNGHVLLNGTGNQVISLNPATTYDTIIAEKASGNLTFDKASSIENLTLTKVQNTTFDDEANITTLTITQSESTTFGGPVQIGTLTDAATAGNFTFSADGNILSDTTFSTTGSVTFGSAANSSFTFGKTDNSENYDVTHISGSTNLYGTLNAKNLTLALTTCKTDNVVNCESITIQGNITCDDAVSYLKINGDLISSGNRTIAPNLMLNGSFTSDATTTIGTDEKSSDFYLFTTSASPSDISVNSVTVTGNLIFSAERNIQTSGSISTANVVLYQGNLISADNSKIYALNDVILLGAQYNIENQQTENTTEYIYQNSERLSSYNYLRPDFALVTSGTQLDYFPDGTTLPTGTNASNQFSGSYTAGSGSIIRADKNFYANGLTLSGDSNWFVDVPDLTDANNGFGEAYNSIISHSTVRCYKDSSTDGSKAKIPAYNCTDNGDNYNWIFDDYDFAGIYTVRDNCIRIEFNRPIRNLNGELISSLSRFSNSDSTYIGFYTDADCTLPLENGNITSGIIYLKAQNTWNTDADGTSSGSASATDRNGTHKEIIPYVEVSKIDSGALDTISDVWGKKLKNYSGENRYTSTIDETGPVLYSVKTGQELHTISDGTAESQHSYDAHNFIEFRYSEPVNFGSESDSSAGLWIPAFDSDGNINLQEDVQVTDSFGALSGDITQEGTLDFTNLAQIQNGKLYTGQNGQANKYVNALYRKDAYSLCLSIAGYTEGQVTDPSENTYKNWTGYIESAVMPSGTVTMNFKTDTSRKNPYVTDILGNGQEDYSDSTQNTIPTVNSTEEALYGTWDLSEPVFAPLRMNTTSTTNGITSNNWNSTLYDGRFQSEAIGNNSGYGSTLDRIEFHLFDNTPSFESSEPEWVSEIGWVNPNSEGKKSDLYTDYSYSADIFGGSRNFDSDESRRTTGGIRYSTICNEAHAFKYVDSMYDDPTESFAETPAYAGANGTIFTGTATPRRSALDLDGLYFGMPLGITSFDIKETFTVSYDSTNSYITDLAGNRLRSATFTTIDRTPPSFDVTLSPLHKNELYITFVKKLVTDSSNLIYIDNSGDVKDVSLSGTFEQIIPSCFKLISIDESGYPSDSTTVQIDTTRPAIVTDKSSDRFTCLKLYLTQDVTLQDVKNLYVSITNHPDYDKKSQDPFTSHKDSLVTFIQDANKNYMEMYSAHALSDFAISTINPLYGYDENMTTDDSDLFDGLYSSGTWGVHDWNTDQQNYGTLPADHALAIVAETDDGTEERTDSPLNARIYLSNNPDSDSVSKQYNSDFSESLRIWLPNQTEKAFSALAEVNNTNYYAVDSNLLDEENPLSGLIFHIPQTITENWNSGDQITFLFALTDASNNTINILHSPELDIDTEEQKYLTTSTKMPLYTLRLTNSEDITSIDLWSFKLKTQTKQRGGVSILNNVINPVEGEKTVIEVDNPSDGNVNVIVLTLDGNIITYLNHGELSQGEHYFTWNGKTKNGKDVARGLYFVRILGNGFDETRKVMVVK